MVKNKLTHTHTQQINRINLKYKNRKLVFLFCANHSDDGGDRDGK